MTPTNSGTTVGQIWQSLTLAQKGLIGFGALGWSVIGLVLLSNVVFGQSWLGCPGSNQQNIDLPVAVMPGSCQVKLKTNLASNNATTGSVFRMVGMTNADTYVFATSASKEKITEFYQQQLKSNGFRSDPVKPGDATGVRINLAGIATLLVVSYTPEQAAQMVEGDIRGKNVYGVMWVNGEFSKLNK
jgi:hypothetical protein